MLEVILLLSLVFIYLRKKTQKKKWASGHKAAYQLTHKQHITALGAQLSPNPLITTERQNIVEQEARNVTAKECWGLKAFRDVTFNKQV